MNTLSLLKTIPYFQNLSENTLKEVLQQSQLIRLRCGEQLIKQGEAGNDAYILLDGRLRAIQENKVILGEISKGEIVGEMAALLGNKRNATIFALRNSLLLQLSKEEFGTLLQQQNDSLTELIKTIIARTTKTYVPRYALSSVAIVPITQGLSLQNHAVQLVQELNAFVSTKSLSQSIVEKEQGVDFNNRDNLDSIFTSYDEAYDLLIYWTDGTWNKWAQYCIGRADKILLVADASHASEISAFEQQLSETLAKVNHAAWELVLLHAGHDKTPTQTRFWLEKRNLERHYHIAPNHLKDLQRLARFLTDNTIAVALSAGGIRSVVQAGVMHALIKGGVPVDIIGGCSGGAFVGSNIACANTEEEILPLVDKAQDLFSTAKQFTFPIVSLFSGRRFTEAIQSFFGDVQIEDLWVDFFCPSLDLASGELVIHKTGPLWKAVRASSSVMGIFPPVIDGDACLVDGGLINACPTNILVQMRAGKIIVVGASSSGDDKFETETKFLPNASGWSLLWKQLNPFYKKRITPTMSTTIIRSMSMAARHLQARVYSDSTIDLFIKPPIIGIGSMEVESGKRLYEMGYDYGMSQIDNWKEQLGLV